MTCFVAAAHLLLFLSFHLHCCVEETRTMSSALATGKCAAGVSKLQSNAQPFTITKTFRSQRRRNLRTDIDMEKQTTAIKRERQLRRLAQDSADYETTFASPESHQIFIKALLNEVERHYVAQLGGTPLKGRMPIKRYVAWRKLHRELGRLGAWCADALTQDERVYGECLSAVGAQQLFAFRRPPQSKPTR